MGEKKIEYDVINLGEYSVQEKRWLRINEKYAIPMEQCNKNENICIENQCFNLRKKDYCTMVVYHYDCEPPECETNVMFLMSVEFLVSRKDN